MKNYLGLDNVAILNGTYKLLRTTGEETEFIGISNYKDGLLDGEQLRFDKEGIIMSINVYRNGELIETKENNTVSEPENLEDDLELVAVITAAIAEFSNTDASNLIVRSIKRVKR